MEAITKEELLAFGMKENEGEDKVLYPMSKVLGEDEEGDTMEICVTLERNSQELALKTPHGDTLYLGGVESIEDLKTFEKCITEFEPNF